MPRASFEFSAALCYFLKLMPVPPNDATQPSRVRTRQRFARLLFLGVGVVMLLGLLAIAAALWLVRADDRSVREIAAPHLGCDPDKITITSRAIDFRDQRYGVSGCGRHGELFCDASDPECQFVEPMPAGKSRPK